MHQDLLTVSNSLGLRYIWKTATLGNIKSILSIFVQTVQQLSYIELQSMRRINAMVSHKRSAELQLSTNCSINPFPC